MKKTKKVFLILKIFSIKIKKIIKKNKVKIRKVQFIYVLIVQHNHYVKYKKKEKKRILMRVIKKK